MHYAFRVVADPHCSYLPYLTLHTILQRSALGREDTGDEGSKGFPIVRRVESVRKAEADFLSVNLSLSFTGLLIQLQRLQNLTYLVSDQISLKVRVHQQELPFASLPALNLDTCRDVADSDN